MAIAGVNIKRNEAADQAAEKHARDEEARLKLLSENNDKTVGAIVDSKIAEYIRTGGAEAMDEADPAALAAANAAHQKQLAPSNFGGATRAPKAHHYPSLGAELKCWSVIRSRIWGCETRTAGSLSKSRRLRVD